VLSPPVCRRCCSYYIPNDIKKGVFLVFKSSIIVSYFVSATLLLRIELKDGAELPSPIDRDDADSADSDDELESPRPVFVTVLPMIHGLETNGRARAHAVLYDKGSLSSDRSSLKFKGKGVSVETEDGVLKGFDRVKSKCEL
jgi:hypothetical protein